jgi:hypothetical protein
MGLLRESVFISYSHKDRRWLVKLQTVLRPLTLNHRITVWADDEIEPGAKWKDAIVNALASAKVAILLVSPHYLASDFIGTVELPRLLKASQEDGLRIIWVAVSACLHGDTPIGAFQAANDPARPLDSMRGAEANRQLVLIAEAIKAAIMPGTDPPNDDHVAGPAPGSVSSSKPVHFKRHALRFPELFTTVLAAAGMSLITGVFFRLWRDEAKLDKDAYVIVFVVFLGLVTLFKWAWGSRRHGRRS